MSLTTNYERLMQGSLKSNVSKLNEVIAQILGDVRFLRADNSNTFTENFDLSKEVKSYEIHLIKLALQLSGGKQRRAAKILGLKNTTLNNKILRYRIFDKS